MKEERRINGFSSGLERDYLSRFGDREIKNRVIEKEISTQLAEDFGVIRFTKKYIFRDGLLVDLDSGESLVEMTARGGVEEETRAIKTIETGLRDNPDETWIYFSPKNKKLGYPENYINIWRVSGNEIIWNGISVKTNFREMNRVRKMLGKNECKDEMDILGSPVGVKMEFANIFDLFVLSEKKYYNNFSYIQEIVKTHIDEFYKEFGDDLTDDSEIIRRLYSACHNFLSTRKGNIISRKDLNNFMFGQLQGIKTETSFGCSGKTTVGAYGGEKGWYITAEGKVVFGTIPNECKICPICKMPYLGEKCPFC